MVQLYMVLEKIKLDVWLFKTIYDYSVLYDYFYFESREDNMRGLSSSARCLWMIRNYMTRQMKNVKNYTPCWQSAYFLFGCKEIRGG